MEIMQFLDAISTTSGFKKKSQGQIKDFYVKNILSHQKLLQKWAGVESIDDYWNWVILAGDLAVQQ